MATTSTVAANTAAAKVNKKYKVKKGVTFNSPVGGNKKARAIIRKINKTISNAPRGSEIRIFSWKIWTRAGVTALLNAQKRGVRVRALMDKKNTVVENNPHFPRLRQGLKKGNKKKWPKSKKSGARLCKKSCRGKGGAAHSKFFLFSQSGKSKHIYMHSSANWGDAAAVRQWNDMFTFVGRKGMYRAAVKVFDEAWKDKPLKPKKRWREFTTGNGKTVLAWSPSNGQSRKKDRLMNTLDKVKCKGAAAGAGNANGRTIITTAPDVIRGNPGMKVARKLRKLWIQGCDVRIGYTVMGKDVNRFLGQPSKRGPVPRTHLAQDFDGDGAFDRYFHLKAWTINGVIGKNKKAFFLQQGSANTSNLALRSDETYAYFINRKAITKRYQRHITYWINNYPRSRALTPEIAAKVASGEIDPYRNMELD